MPQRAPRHAPRYQTWRLSGSEANCTIPRPTAHRRSRTIACTSTRVPGTNTRFKLHVSWGDCAGHVNAQYTMHVINAHLGHFNLKAPNAGGGCWGPGSFGQDQQGPRLL